MLFDRQTLLDLFYKFHHKFEESEGHPHPTADDIAEQMYTHLMDNSHSQETIDSLGWLGFFEDFCERHMESKRYRDYVEETERLIAEAEYEKRHPYKSRGVGKSMFM